MLKEYICTTRDPARHSLFLSIHIEAMLIMMGEDKDKPSYLNGKTFVYETDADKVLNDMKASKTPDLSKSGPKGDGRRRFGHRP